MGIKDCNEAEVMAVLEALRIYHTLFQHFLIVERDSARAISWVESLRGPWKTQFLLNEIRHLISDTQVTFHINRSTNGMADSLAK